MPTFSIVTPTYNSIRYLANCLDSVRYACKGMDYEHIFADGGSDDGTWEYLQSQHAIDDHIKLIPGPDNGMYDALNKAITMATSPLIGHLNSDEQYNKVGLQACLTKFKENKSLDAVFSPTVMLNSEMQFLQIYKQVVIPKTVDTYWCMPVQSCSLIYTKKAWERYPYNSNLRLAADHDWFRKQMEQGLNITNVELPIGIFVWSAGNLSNTLGQTNPEDVLKDIDKQSLKIKMAKHWYRLKKLFNGGYKSTSVSYEYFDHGILKKQTIDRPALKVDPKRLR